MCKLPMMSKMHSSESLSHTRYWARMEPELPHLPLKSSKVWVRLVQIKDQKSSPSTICCNEMSFGFQFAISFNPLQRCLVFDVIATCMLVQQHEEAYLRIQQHDSIHYGLLLLVLRRQHQDT